jgi:hypothetical protein
MNMTKPCFKKKLRPTQTLEFAVVGELSSSYKGEGRDALNR